MRPRLNFKFNAPSISGIRTSVGALCRILVRLLLAPSAVAGFALLLNLLPERNLELSLRWELDLRAAALLSAVLAAVASFMAAPVAAKAEPALTPRARAVSEVEEKVAVEATEEQAPAAQKEVPEPEPHVFDYPEELLRSLVSFPPIETNALQRLECPVCHDVMLIPRKMPCSHTACKSCLERMVAAGHTECPCCKQRFHLKDLVPASKEVKSDLSAFICSCKPCKEWTGTFSDFTRHMSHCPAVHGAVGFYNARHMATAQEHRSQSLKIQQAASVFEEMRGASPALVHRFPAASTESTDAGGAWASPIFNAEGRLWTIRMGPHGSNGSRYFCLLPHGHNDRLRCSFVFAKTAGAGFKERRVHDWPTELAGHPWGPTIPAEELAGYKQADGSILLMVHAVGLGSEESSAPVHRR